MTIMAAVERHEQADSAEVILSVSVCCSHRQPKLTSNVLFNEQKSTDGGTVNVR